MLSILDPDAVFAEAVNARFPAQQNQAHSGGGVELDTEGWEEAGAQGIRQWLRDGRQPEWAGSEQPFSVFAEIRLGESAHIEDEHLSPALRMASQKRH